MSECEMCSMKIFHLNYRSVGDPGPLMYFGNIREKLTINSNLENDKTLKHLVSCYIDQNYAFLKNVSHPKYKIGENAPKKYKFNPKTAHEGGFS